MPFLVEHPFYGYLVRPRTGDEERADDANTYGDRKQAHRFATREQAEETVGPLAELVEIKRVQK